MNPQPLWTAEQVEESVITGAEALLEHLAEHLASEIREVEVLSFHRWAGRMEVRDRLDNVYAITVARVNR